MLLLNTRNKAQEAMFDGKVTEFKPFELKDVYDKVEGDHLFLKLGMYGVVEIKNYGLKSETIVTLSDDGSLEINEKFQKEFSEGLSALRVTLDRVVGNFRGMNKEREAAKMGRELPSPYIIECVKELSWIDTILKKVNAKDYELVDKYLNDQETREAGERIDEADREVVQSTTGSEITGNATYDRNGKHDTVRPKKKK